MNLCQDILTAVKSGGLNNWATTTRYEVLSGKRRAITTMRRSVTQDNMDKILSVIKGQMTAGEIATASKFVPNSAYKYIAKLVDDGVIVKSQKGQPHLSTIGRDTGSNTKFPTQVLPGGRDYRELLITLPTKTPVGISYSANAIKNAESSGQFTSSHYPDHPNLIGHVRFDTRDDANGRTGTFAQEFQSDWGIAGSKSGFDSAKVIQNTGNDADHNRSRQENNTRKEGNVWILWKNYVYWSF